MKIIARIERPGSFLILIAALIAAAVAPPALRAQENPLRKPVWEFGPWVQGGAGAGEASQFRFVAAGVRVGRVLTGVIGNGRFRGTFQWAADFAPVYSVRQSLFYDRGPKDWIYGVALNPIILKWNWTASSKVVPYLAAEGGMLITTRDVPTTDSSSFNFLPGGAFGVYFLRSKSQAVDLSLHVTHISNASLADHNPGVNSTVQIRLGYSWFK